MTDLPYTDDDLRAEAARLHAGAARSADDRIRPTIESKWRSLDADQIDEACDELVSLLDRAADVSEWAINLGADGLEPTEHTVDIDSSTLGGQFVRLHFAFHTGTPEDARTRFVAGLREALRTAMTT